jgi:hypothetical protein
MVSSNAFRAYAFRRAQIIVEARTALLKTMMRVEIEGQRLWEEEYNEEIKHQHLQRREREDCNEEVQQKKSPKMFQYHYFANLSNTFKKSGQKNTRLLNYSYSGGDFPVRRRFINLRQFIAYGVVP